MYWTTTLLQCDYYTRGYLDKVDPIGLQENNNIVQESWLWANQQVVKKTIRYSQNSKIDSKRFSRIQNVSPDNVLLFETLHATPRRHICVTQGDILSFTNDFFATIAVFCNNMRP